MAVVAAASTAVPRQRSGLLAVKHLVRVRVRTGVLRFLRRVRVPPIVGADAAGAARRPRRTDSSRRPYRRSVVRQTSKICTLIFLYLVDSVLMLLLLL